MPAAGLERDLEVRRLNTGEEPEVLNLLNRQPLRNVFMIGSIRDHGLESARHRGIFYGCFRRNQLIGVALIGHHVVLSDSDETITAFANAARLCHEAELRVMLGDPGAVEKFCRILTQEPCHLAIHQTQSQTLFTLNKVKDHVKEVEGLRPAQVADLDEVVRSHAQFCLEQSGVDPLTQDSEGFRQRVLARIERGRVWIASDARGITFKADVASETEEAVYLEGVWTRPDLRGAGLATSAMKDLSQRLLHRYQVVCLFAETGHKRVQSFYQRLGFEPLATYHMACFRSTDSC